MAYLKIPYVPIQSHCIKVCYSIKSALYKKQSLIRAMPALTVIVSSGYCFVHPIFCLGFWYFGHFSCVIFFPVFFRLVHLALQNKNKDYVIFLYFHNFITKSGQKLKMG